MVCYSNYWTRIIYGYRADIIAMNEFAKSKMENLKSRTTQALDEVLL